MLAKTNKLYTSIGLNTLKWNLGKVSSVYYSNNKSSTYNVIAEPRKTVSEDESRKYFALCPKIIQDLTERYQDMPKVTERFVKVLEFNIPHHEQASGLAVLGAYKAFEPAENLTPQNIHLANILGWCVDLLLCSYRINDDIMDGSEIRNGLPVWHRNPGVGFQAINDACFVENCPYILLQKYLSDHSSYIPCTDWLHIISIKVALGMSLDTMNRINGKPNLDEFTMKRYEAIAKYKGTYPEYLMPIKLGMYLANKYNDNTYKEIQHIMAQVGLYFTAQNDILDCYGDVERTGRIGDDIKEGKCTWLVVKALERASPAQKQLLKEHYGTVEPESESKVQNLYKELGILDSFLKYEEETYDKIHKDIKQSKNLPEDFIIKLVDTSYGRN